MVAEPGGTAEERTLVLLKPDALKHLLGGRIVQRLEDAGLTLVASVTYRMDAGFVARQYPDLAHRRGPEVFAVCVERMTRSPVVALVLQGADAVAVARAVIGPAYPDIMPGTVRGDLLYRVVNGDGTPEWTSANLVHASSTCAEADYEINLWFGESEVVVTASDV